MADISPSPPSEVDTSGAIEDAEEVCRLLVRLRRMRNLLTIRPADSPREFTSMLLSMDLARRYLVLDAPRPRPPGGPLHAGTRLYVQSQLDGAALVMVTRIDSLIGNTSDDDPADASLMVDWPSRLSYYERRQDYRVTVPATLIASPARIIIDQRARPARLVDISASGAALMLSRETLPVKEGDELDCVLPLPERDLKLPMTVCSVAKGRDGQRIGGTLRVSTPRDAELLQRSVTAIERWWLQHHP